MPNDEQKTAEQTVAKGKSKIDLIKRAKKAKSTGLERQEAKDVTLTKQGHQLERKQSRDK